VSRSATLLVEPLEVQPRWLAHIVLMLVLLGVVIGMVALRRGDLDIDDDLWAAAVLVGAFWVLAFALGSFVRSVHAGYALRLDAHGVHVPGLDVVPWHAVHGADLRQYEKGGKRFAHLIVHIDAAREAAALRRYERYLFGPLAGILGSRGKIVVPVMLLAVEPQSLLARTRAFVERDGTIATAKRNLAAAQTERQAAGRRLP
jgi:hypothetical protein